VNAFFLRVVPPRPDFALTMDGTEQEMMAAHAAYWAGLARAGHVVAFGPVLDPSGPYGVGLVLARDLDEVDGLVGKDPAMVSSDGFVTEVQPMGALVTAEGRVAG
jgi:hypothetical protein